VKRSRRKCPVGQSLPARDAELFWNEHSRTFLVFLISIEFFLVSSDLFLNLGHDLVKGNAQLWSRAVRLHCHEVCPNKHLNFVSILDEIKDNVNLMNAVEVFCESGDLFLDKVAKFWCDFYVSAG
jgi:hypothetical protein